MQSNAARQECFLSLVIPVYNSEKIFPELYRRLTEVLEKIAPSYEIIAVVDGCRDQSIDVIAAIAAKDRRIKVIEFSRNFGHQAAVTAGLHVARGKLIGIMDDDLEDPPEVIPDFVNKINDGYEVVYGIRRSRKRSLVYRLLYASFYRILAKMTDVDMPVDAGDFCVMRRAVADVINSMPENNRYLRGMRAWVGFRQAGVEYARGVRLANESGYDLNKYFELACTAIFSFSYKPLKYVSAIGALVAFSSFAVAAYIVGMKLAGKGPAVSGWVSLLVSVLLLSGIQLISVGILGQYLARVYDEVKKRPAYIIRQMINVEHEVEHD